jgi:hypothetical protein
MRNRWGIEIKKGYHAWASWGNRNEPIEGKITGVDKSSDFATAYAPRVTLTTDDGSVFEVGIDSISQVLPPMRIKRGGVVVANPTPRLKRYDQPSQRERISERTGRPTKTPSKRLKERRLMTHHEAPPGVWANPLTRVKLKSPAQRSGEVPEKGSRLYERRKVTQKAPAGFYANPTAGNNLHVEYKTSDGKWKTVKRFPDTKLGHEQSIAYAHAYAEKYPSRTIRVYWR